MKNFMKVAAVAVFGLVLGGCVENSYTVVKPDGTKSVVDYYAGDNLPDRIFLDGEYVGVATNNVAFDSNALSQIVIIIGNESVTIDCKEYSINVETAEVQCDVRSITASTFEAIPVGSTLEYEKSTME